MVLNIEMSDYPGTVRVIHTLENAGDVVCQRVLNGRGSVCLFAAFPQLTFKYQSWLIFYNSVHSVIVI